MSRPVYILGAGFSRNFNQDMFPLVSDFLSVAKARSIYEPEQKHQDLALVIRRYFGNDTYQNIEKVLSFLAESPLYNRQIPLEHRPIVYEELVEIIVGVLSGASQTNADTELIQETYQRFAELLNETESTVITFNYDMLLERLLRNVGWQQYYGYGVHIPLTHEAMPTPPNTYPNQSNSENMDTDRKSLVTVLKLHGSINWGMPIIAEDKTHAIYQIPLRGGVSMADFAIQTERGSPFTQYFRPVIVPPVLDKSLWFRNPTFRVVWNMAMEAIEQASEITFVGYSLRATDFMAEFMFRQAVSMQPIERKITVVDPRASELEERYRDVFDLPGSMVTFSFEPCDFVTYANTRTLLLKPLSVK